MAMFFNAEPDINVKEILACPNIKQSSVNVIFKDANLVLKWKKSVEKLSNHVGSILSNKVIEEKSLMKCNHELAHLIGIDSLEVISDHYGLITRRTKINVNNLISLARYKQLTSKRPKLGGLDSTVKMLTDLFQLSKGTLFSDIGMDSPKGVLLQGPAGCGKTSIVRQVATDVGAFVLVVNGPELLGSRRGETMENLTNIFRMANDHASEGPCILFLDEVDSMCAQSEKAEDGRIVAHLCRLMDECRDVMVIAATNRPNAVHRSLRRPGRFDREIFIGVPTVRERQEILRVLVDDLPMADDVRLDAIAEATRGYVGADMAQLCREAAYFCLLEKKESCVSMADFDHALHTIRPSTQRNSQARVDFRPVQWSQIAGLESVKSQIKQALEWPILHPEAFLRLGLNPPRGLLLYGPPGCAKTTLVRAAATSCKATFLTVTGAQIYSPYVGDSERTIAQIFHEARLGAPSILFLDELDSIVGTRSKSQTGVQERVLSTLLNLMDGIGVKLNERTRTEKVREGEDGSASGQVEVGSLVPHVMVVGATNRPDLVDSALMRPGRLDRIVYVPPPDLETRHCLLSLLTSRMPLASDVDLTSLAEMTENFTGADLENLCNEAGLYALTISDLKCQQIKHEHFLRTLERVTPSLTADNLIDYANCLTNLK